MICWAEKERYMLVIVHWQAGPVCFGAAGFYFDPAPLGLHLSFAKLQKSDRFRGKAPCPVV